MGSLDDNPRTPMEIKFKFENDVTKSLDPSNVLSCDQSSDVSEI